jgi:RND family efflux transporter MFP subunit
MNIRCYRLFPLTFLALFSMASLAENSAPGTTSELLDCVIEPRSIVDLGSHAEGILVEIMVERGDRVKEGQPLIKLDSTMEEISADLARLKAENETDLVSRRTQMEYRLKELKRLETMRSSKTASEKTYDQADTEYQLAKISMAAAEIDQRLAGVEQRRAMAMLERRQVNSPVDGIVIDVLMSKGEYVHEQSQLMKIAELNPLHVEVYIPVADYGLVRQGMTALVYPEEPVGGEYEAVVKVVDNVFDPASRTFGVRLNLDNSDYSLPAGLRCQLKFIE